MLIAVIADDLTGAADTGVQLVNSGYQVAVAFRGSPVPSAHDLDAVALDTDSRSMPAGFAARRVVEAAHALRGARVVYKKLDSTLRGPIAAELAAALGATGRGKVVVAPAFPGMGRTTVGGVQMVHGVPVHKTEASDDPHAPVSEGHLPTLLEDLGPVASLGVGDLGDSEKVRRILDGCRCLVADAEDPSHLAALVGAVPDPSAVLWAGSAGLALAFGGVYPGPRAGETPSGPGYSGGAALVVVGSLSGAARGQLRAWAKKREAVPVAVEQPGAVEEAVGAVRAALSAGGDTAVYSSEARGDRGRMVVEALAEVVGRLSEERLFGALVLTGGDTAVGVARRLGASGIRLAGEVGAGVPLGALVGPRPYPVVTKAGGFGGENALLEAVEALRRGGKG